MASWLISEARKDDLDTLLYRPLNTENFQHNVYELMDDEFRPNAIDSLADHAKPPGEEYEERDGNCQKKHSNDSE